MTTRICGGPPTSIYGPLQKLIYILTAVCAIIWWFVGSARNRIKQRNVNHYKRYCFIVAGGQQRIGFITGMATHSGIKKYFRNKSCAKYAISTVSYDPRLPPEPLDLALCNQHKIESLSQFMIPLFLSNTHTLTKTRLKTNCKHTLPLPV